MVNLLLRSGADETITNDEGKTPADVIGEWWEDDEEEEPVVMEVERARRLLATAPADKAWRRRAYLVLYRAHPDRLHQQQTSSGRVGMARGTGGDVKLARAEGNGVGGGDVVDEKVDANWADMLANLVGLQEEDIFRTIVGYV